jgi:hexosaminidase
MNVLHWHLSDDQGWRIESAAFPALHSVEGQPYYTRREIGVIVAFAGERGIEVIPEIDLPGHTTAILAAYPRLGCRRQPVALARSGGIFPIVLCPGRQETFNFVFALLEDVAALFPSPRFHIGGDEVPTTEWAACDDCRKLMAKLGLERPEQLQRVFTERVATYLRALGKQPLLWNDCLRGGPAPAEALVQYWVDMEAHSPMIAHVRAGRDAVFSGMPHCYFDYPHGAIPLKKVYRYRPGVEGLDASAMENTRGIECCVWTERIAEPALLERMLFLRALAIAEIAWSRRRDYRDFTRRLRAHLHRLQQASVDYTPEALWDPKGAERRSQVVGCLQIMTGSVDENAQSMEGVFNLRVVLRLARELFQPSDLLHLRGILRALKPQTKAK